MQPSPSASATTDVPTGLSTNLPKIITNPNASATAPEGMSSVQIGFNWELNYNFVVNNPLSSAQIFKYLPMGIADGLVLHPDQVIMHSLYPIDTTDATGYVTTGSMSYIPSSFVTTLGLDLHTPSSLIYNSNDSSVNTLVNLINPAIPLIPGSPDGTTTGGSPGSSPSNTGAGGNSGVFDPDSQNTSSGTKASTAGIAMAAIGGSAAYGAAMFLIARRYKKRKQGHRRSNSVMSAPEMMQSGSPALMGGAAYMSGGRASSALLSNDRNSRGSGGSNSARTQQISGPMMAENSLGWN